MEKMVQLTWQTTSLVPSEQTHEKQAKTDTQNSIQATQENPHAKAAGKDQKFIQFPKKDLGNTVDITGNF